MKHPLQQALDDYLALRRSLGFKLHEEGRQLPQFLVFLQKNRAAYITARLALDWIMQSAGLGRTQRLRAEFTALLWKWRAEGGLEE